MKKWCVGWGPIPYCNMKCEFCYSKKVREQEDNILCFNDWKHFIDRNHQMIESINYGTGENALSKDWFRLLSYVLSKNSDIRQGVTTNGYLSEAIREDSEKKSIVTKALSEIDVSLDYCDEKKHNKFRGQPNAFRWAMNTLQEFQGEKLLTIVMLGTNDTLSIYNIAGIMEIAAKYGAKMRINLYRPTGGITPSAQRFIPSYKTIMTALHYLSAHHSVLSISDPLFNSILVENPIKPICDPSGTKSIRILHNGEITPSTYLISSEFRKCNITDGDVLNTLDEKMTSFLSDIPDACATCRFSKTCRGGVLDRRYLWYGTAKERDPYCPFREDNELPTFSIKIKSKKEFTSIHDDYLATMFFEYKKEIL